jgi:Glycosyl transferases group 1
VTLALVAGALANKPWNGGNAWSRLSFALGLRRLGFDVLFLEEMAEPDAQAREYFRLVCDRFDIDGVLLTSVAPRAVVERAGDAAFLLNIGGHLTDPEVVGATRNRIFVDDDPGYTQIWHAQGLLGDRLAGHDALFTVGLNVGRHDCDVPSGGFTWHPMLPPVPLEFWPATVGGTPRRFTTVASWRGAYGPLEHEGRTYGQKAHEFRKVVELPTQVEGDFEIALDIDPGDHADARLLERNGWRLVDPHEMAGTPEAFREYVQLSGAEFSVAQGAYVETRCGWFSDRTAKYLASGLPALVQDTGLEGVLPVGEGIVCFSNLHEAVEGVRKISTDYETHRQAARAFAEEHLSAERVLARMLDQAGVR